MDHNSVIAFYDRFVAPAASDWSLYEAAFPLSIVFLLQGVSASLVVYLKYILCLVLIGITLL